jgi:uncharacterized phiE125 gp8 family phage protein
LADVKAHLRVDHDDEDALISSLLAGACGAVSEEIGRVLSAETWTLSFPQHSGDLVLPIRPVSAITAVAYYDRDDVEQSGDPDDFYLFPHPDRPVLRPKSDKKWPDVIDREDAISLTVSAGLASVPDEILAAIKLLIGHWYENRNAVDAEKMGETPIAYRHICDLHRAKWLTA